MILTSDDSTTLYSAEYEEAYHTKNGALTEAFDKYCAPCGIAELAGIGRVKILDIGFGLGYNVLAAIFTARAANSACQIEITSLEKDVITRKVLDSLKLPEKYSDSFEIVKSVVNTLSYNDGQFAVEIITGDARKSIQKLDKKYDAVFLDPFSYKNNVELWTVEFFREILKKMSDTGILSTYSMATPVRCGLISAGFKIGSGPGDVMKKGGTLATINGNIEPFSAKYQEKFNTSPEKTPFYDPNLDFTKEEIFAYRERLKLTK